jgi:uncharacterized protein
MPVFYLKTSALVKRYRSEPGTEVVEQLLNNPRPEDRFFISFVSIIELTSGILRLAKAGQLRDTTATQILAQFRSDIRELYRVWPLNEEVAISAVSVVEQHKLRSLDALHLAAAQTIAGLAPGALTVVVTSDRELLTAAEAVRLGVLDPQAPGAIVPARGRGFQGALQIAEGAPSELMVVDVTVEKNKIGFRIPEPYPIYGGGTFEGVIEPAAIRGHFTFGGAVNEEISLKRGRGYWDK